MSPIFRRIPSIAFFDCHRNWLSSCPRVPCFCWMYCAVLEMVKRLLASTHVRVAVAVVGDDGRASKPPSGIIAVPTSSFTSSSTVISRADQSTSNFLSFCSQFHSSTPNWNATTTPAWIFLQILAKSVDEVVTLYVALAIGLTPRSGAYASTRAPCGYEVPRDSQRCK